MNIKNILFKPTGKKLHTNCNVLSASEGKNIEQSSSKLFSRSRDLARNNSIATSIIDLFILGTLGNGLKLNANVDNDYLKLPSDEVAKLNAQIEAEFNLWAESTFCDSERQLNFYGLQELALRHKLESGEVIAFLAENISFRSINRYINVIESELLSTPPHLKDNAQVHDGIRKNEDGTPSSYFFKADKSTLPTGADPHLAYIYNYKEILAYDDENFKQILHIYKKTQDGQNRGTPFFAPVVDDILQLTQYTCSEHDCSVNNIVQSILSQLKSIATKIGFPFETILYNFSMSYSMSEAALLESKEFFMAERQTFINEFISPIYERFFIDGIKAKLIHAPNFFDDLKMREAYLSANWIANITANNKECSAKRYK